MNLIIEGSVENRKSPAIVEHLNRIKELCESRNLRTELSESCFGTLLVVHDLDKMVLRASLTGVSHEDNVLLIMTEDPSLVMCTRYASPGCLTIVGGSVENLTLDEEDLTWILVKPHHFNFYMKLNRDNLVPVLTHMVSETYALDLIMKNYEKEIVMKLYDILTSPYKHLHAYYNDEMFPGVTFQDLMTHLALTRVNIHQDFDNLMQHYHELGRRNNSATVRRQAYGLLMEINKFIEWKLILKPEIYGLDFLDSFTA